MEKPSDEHRETGRRMEEIYRSLPEGEIPWVREEPPELLRELVEAHKLGPRRALDIGCGTGSYSLYLARKGFDVTGVDVSSSAIERAKEKAAQSGLPVRFLAADMAGDVSGLTGSFDFILEWMIMHHILPPERPRYLANVRALAGKGAGYLSVSFSAEDTTFGIPPEGKWRKSPMGPTVYCSGLEELKDFFAPQFEIMESRVLGIPGRTDLRFRANYLWMRRR
jgi:cyclopropane fatty-acyl-phospholipid synthase-like methyltransferase